MKNALEFLMQLRQQNVQLHFENGKLACKPQSAHGVELQKGLESFGGDILKILGKQPSLAGRKIGTQPERWPLSPVQQYYWILDQLFPQNDLLCETLELNLGVPLKAAILRRSIVEMVRRHPVLRLVFKWEKGVLYGLVGQPHPGNFLWLEQVDTKGLEKRPGLNLHGGPLFQVMLFCNPDGRQTLKLTIHKIIADEHSANRFLHLLNHLYLSFAKGTPPVFVDYGGVYRQLAVARSKPEAMPNYDAQLRFWRENLNGDLTRCQLPGDHPRKTMPGLATGVHEFEFPTGLHQKSLKLAALRSTSVRAVFLAGFYALIHRYTHQRDLLVGTIDRRGRGKSRSAPETWPLLSRDQNRLALRIKLKALESFAALVDASHRVSETAKAHGELPYERLLSELEIPRGFGRDPLVRAMFHYSESGETPPSFGGGIARFGGAAGLSKEYEITLALQQTPAGMVGRIQFDSEIFEPRSIARMAAYYMRLLSRCCADPQSNYGKVRILTDRERSNLLTRWNHTRTALPASRTLHGLFEDQAHRFPHRIALIHQNADQIENSPVDSHLGFGHLNQRADQLAGMLVRMGIRPGDSVALHTDRNLQGVIGTLGILKAGATVLQMDPEEPNPQQHLSKKNAVAAVILTRRRHMDRWRHPLVICLDVLARAEDEPRLNRPRLLPCQTAFLLPKTVSRFQRGFAGITHEGLVNYMNWLATSFPLERRHRVLQRAPFTDDVSLTELFWPLTSGAPCILADSGHMGDAASVLKVISDHCITHGHFMPSMLADLETTVSRDTPMQLHLALCGREPLPVSLLKRVSKQLPQLRIVNLYGRPETAVASSFWSGTDFTSACSAPIGRAIANTRCYVLDPFMNPGLPGLPGELYIAGPGLGPGFIHQPARTAAQFVPNPFDDAGERLFKTEDSVCLKADGQLQFLETMTQSMSLRGIRIDRDLIVQNLERHPDIAKAEVMVWHGINHDGCLVAYLVPKKDAGHRCAGHRTAGPPDDGHIDPKQVRDHLVRRLPNNQVPEFFEIIEDMPLDEDGRVDKGALPSPRNLVSKWKNRSTRAYSAVEKVLTEIWQRVLVKNQVGVGDNFFDLGGDSLALMAVYQQLPEILAKSLKPMDLFNNPNIEALARFLENQTASGEQREQENLSPQPKILEGMNIAVIGMAGRFPGADNPDEFWQNLRNGKSSVSFFSDETLKANHIPESVFQNPNYVKARAVVSDVEGFDAGFFDFTPREAQVTDPQQRLFLECAWQALEDAGYAPEKTRAAIGIFGGIGNNDYLENHIRPNPNIVKAVGHYPIALGNDKDNLCTRISYKLGLTGPSMVVQTACSSSMVAIHQACRALLADDCQLALAGGVALGPLRRGGYMHEEGMLTSPDGHSRAFDKRAQGTVPGQGAGMVVLKRLHQALADGDQVYAVIKGTAINNDGQNKQGYTGYGVEGQAAVIRKAHQHAGISPTAIDYVETSSTASALGDPIEVEALNRVFQTSPKRPNSVALGALKPNIGTLDTASGVAAFMKTVLSLRHGEMVPTIDFDTPNPSIDFDGGPFFVNTSLRPFGDFSRPRRAGVSSFGMGGTNAHAVLEEAPTVAKRRRRERPWKLIVWSAKSPGALDALTGRLAAFFRKTTPANFADAAYTLQVGRSDFMFRRMLVCRNQTEAVLELDNHSSRILTGSADTASRSVAFMFPGQGSQYQNMGLQLYRTEAVFRMEADRCWKIIRERAPGLYKGLTGRDRSGVTEKIHRTYFTQPALFILEYALAKLLISWGIVPKAMIGNSLGEVVAACIAEVFSLEEALEAVVTRGRLMQELPPGDQAIVGLGEEAVQPYLNQKISLAAVINANRCVVAGDKLEIRDLWHLLREKGVFAQRLHAPHAFHSHMVEPIVEPYAKVLSRFKLKAPKIPFISNVTGTWIKDDQATDPWYWARHLREPVRFSQGISHLLEEPNRVLLEVGPEKTLSSLAMQHTSKTRNHRILATMRHPQEDESDLHCLMTTMGRLWLSGVPLHWEALHAGSHHGRIPLPGHPLDRKRHWIDPPKSPGHGDDFLQLEEDTISAPIPTGSDDHYRPNVATDFVAPRNGTETEIAQTWCRFLGLEEVGIYDDFFELGGTSLLAVRLLAQLGKHFGVPLAGHIMLQKRTVEALAEFIANNRTEAEHGPNLDNSILVEIQRGYSQNPPLYLVHPIGGEVYFYRELARYLGSEQPVFGLRAPSLTGEMEPFSDLVAQARFYVEELLQNHPEPPYIIGGASYGGVVAYEMARQLQERGLTVPLIVMIDSPAPGTLPEKLNDSAAILHYLLGDQLQISRAELADLDPEEQLAYVFEEARFSDKLDVLPPSLGLPMFKTWIAHQDAMDGYHLQDTASKVVFFRHTERTKHNPPNLHLTWLPIL